MKKSIDKCRKRCYNGITTNPNSENSEDIMNRYYDFENERKSNCSYIGKIESENDNIADSFIALLCAIIGLFKSEGFRTVLRIGFTLICFIGFVGIIGGVEAGTMNVGLAIILAAFMVFIEILCFIPSKASK